MTHLTRSNAPDKTWCGATDGRKSSKNHRVDCPDCMSAANRVHLIVKGGTANVCGDISVQASYKRSDVTCQECLKAQLDAPGKEYVVRIAAAGEAPAHFQSEVDKVFSNPVLIRNLKHAGIITVHRQDAELVCYDLHMPGDQILGRINASQEWAANVAGLLASDGVNAVVAPGTR